MNENRKQDLQATLYILQKIKGFNYKVFKALYEREFDFLSFPALEQNSLKKFNVPDHIIENFKLYDIKKVKSYIQDLNNQNVQVISIYDKEYPDKLRNIYDPPVLLYALGDTALLNCENPGIAVVGTRKCSPYGEKVTRKITGELVEKDILVISGMADGIDSFAHLTALENNGKTVAVLGGGFDQIYPKKNLGLFEEIARKGLVLSEYEPRTEPRPHFFPMRNRIVSGLSDGVLVVEGKEKSGALISAYLAMEQGREVFAVPGDINSKVSRGPHKLIKEGAKLTQETSDILEEYPFESQLSLFSAAAQQRKPEKDRQPARKRKIPADLSPFQKEILKELGTSPVSLDDITEKVQKPVSQVMAALLEMEITGLVKQVPGKKFYSEIEAT